MKRVLAGLASALAMTFPVALHAATSGPAVASPAVANPAVSSPAAATETPRITQAPSGRQQLRVMVLRDERIKKRRVAVVLRDWFYCFPPTGEIIRVPAGYLTDFASIPPDFWWIVPPFGDQTEAAVVHDWLFAVGETGAYNHANKVFHYALVEQHVPVAKADAMYRIVETFGRAAYGRDNEWREHFRDTETGVRLEPWYPKPATAIVGHSPTRCVNWDAESADFAAHNPSLPRPSLALPSAILPPIMSPLAVSPVP